MRKEPFSVNSFVHVYNRGNRKQLIVRDAKDRWHFLQMLYYFNDYFSPANIFRELRELLKFDFNKKLVWPESWPKRRPLVKIIAFSLLDDHFHFLLKEIQEGGVTMFMRKLGTGMTNYSNTKHQESGRLFQGSYKARLVDSDIYLRYLSVYIQVKNIFELYPGGLEKAVKEFDKAFDFAVNYPFCSLADYATDRKSPILDKDVFEELFLSNREYKEFARECILGMNFEDKLGSVIEGLL